MATQISRRTSKMWDATPAIRDPARIQEFTMRCAWGEGKVAKDGSRAAPMRPFEDANVNDGGLRLHAARPDPVSYAPGSMAVLPKAMRLKEIR